MKKFFIDTIHLMTDRMGGWDNQWIEIGWYDKNPKRYFNLDEVKQFYDEGDTENVRMSEDGKLYMETEWADARTAFNVTCGIPFKKERTNENLLAYAKKIGIVTEEPIPIDMLAGIKTLEINDDGTYNVRYKIKKEKYIKPLTKQFERLCIGTIKRLIYSGESGFRCREIIFDHDQLTLIINGISSAYVATRDFIDCIRDLDLELLILNPNVVNYSNVMSACISICRDLGQYHWLKETREDGERKSNVYWYDYDRKEKK